MTLFARRDAKESHPSSQGERARRRHERRSEIFQDLLTGADRPGH